MGAAAAERGFRLQSRLQAAQVGALKAVTADGLFIGQSPEFFAVLTRLAKVADAARHGS